MENGETELDDMIADIKQGLHITELMGSSVSMTTGDYSRGASGFWIENGKLALSITKHCCRQFKGYLREYDPGQ